MMINNINTYWSFQIYSNLQKYKLNKSTYFFHPHQAQNSPQNPHFPHHKPKAYRRHKRSTVPQNKFQFIHVRIFEREGNSLTVNSYNVL